MLNITSQDHDEVVALCVDGDIYFGEYAKDKAKATGTVEGIIPRSVFKLVAHLDYHPKWDEYAEYPTLFTISEYNEWQKLPNGKPIC